MIEGDFQLLKVIANDCRRLQVYSRNFKCLHGDFQLNQCNSRAPSAFKTLNSDISSSTSLNEVMWVLFQLLSISSITPHKKNASETSLKYVIY